MATLGVALYPFGVGMLDFSTLNDLSNISYLSDYFYAADAHGGTAIINKGLGEFGVFFVGIIIFSLYLLFNNLLKSSNNLTSLVENMFIFAWMVSLYRGASYFDSSTLIGLSVVICRLVSFRLSHNVKFAKKEVVKADQANRVNT